MPERGIGCRSIQLLISLQCSAVSRFVLLDILHPLQIQTQRVLPKLRL
ncbi:MAG UNVERIFIED_CONTAM: hypothetical protein LVR18_43135 [Planctomycetaceae bacterium]